MTRQRGSFVDEDDSTGAYQDYHLTTEPDGSIAGNCVTNDNHDLGVPNEFAEWKVRFRNYDEMASIQNRMAVPPERRAFASPPLLAIRPVSSRHSARLAAVRNDANSMPLMRCTLTGADDTTSGPTLGVVR